MLREINENFYCTGDFYLPDSEVCQFHGDHCCNMNVGCLLRHRKHPTPEQYKKEYGREVPEDIPVWVSWKEEDPDHNWQLMYFEYAEHLDISRSVVIACTPFGKPDKDWRPK